MVKNEILYNRTAQPDLRPPEVEIKQQNKSLTRWIERTMPESIHLKERKQVANLLEKCHSHADVDSWDHHSHQVDHCMSGEWNINKTFWLETLTNQWSNLLTRVVVKGTSSPPQSTRKKKWWRGCYGLAHPWQPRAKARQLLAFHATEDHHCVSLQVSFVRKTNIPDNNEVSKSL